MKYLLCGILGIILGFLIFYLLFRIANKNRLYRKLKAEGKKKLPKPNFTKAVLVAVLFTYFVGLYIGIKVTLILLTIRRIGNVYSHADNYSNCLVLLESQGRKHYQNQTGIPGGNKGYTR